MVDVKTPDVMNGFRGYSILQAPAVYKNLLVVGGGTGEGPGGREGGAGPAGDTRAFDARSGKLVWTFHTVPRPGDVGYDSWEEPESTIMRSGVNTWGYFSVDEARHILFMPLGAPNNDRVGIDRPGNGLFGSSVVAVNADTGAYMWHFQLVHHDAWDYDAPEAPLLVDIRHGGKTIPVVLAMNKASLLFTLDRVTGKPIFPVEERPVPASDVPGEKMSPTQPFPVKPRPLGQHTVSRDNLYKGDPTLQAYCEHMVDDNHMKLGGPFLPIANNQYSISPPGPAGGVNFWGGTFDPKRNLFVTNVSNVFQPMRLVQGPDGGWRNQGPLAGLRRFGDVEHHLLCGPTPWGELVAVNMDTGDVVYDKSLGVSEMLAPQYQNTGRPGGSGAFTTASGLTFIGATDDNRLRAFKTATGEKVWETKLEFLDRGFAHHLQGGRWTAIHRGGGHGRRHRHRHHRSQWRCIDRLGAAQEIARHACIASSSPLPGSILPLWRRRRRRCHQPRRRAWLAQPDCRRARGATRRSGSAANAMTPASSRTRLWTRKAGSRRWTRWPKWPTARTTTLPPSPDI